MQSSADATDQLQLWNQRLHAFIEFCEEDAGHVAEPGSVTSQGLLGTTLGVKDIIDVVGVPTRNGSKTCLNPLPARADAPVVAALRDAGARVIGKTVTTEFAFTDPTDCRNPYDLTRSPGGSSSGSGAAVAAGMVDIALGTQTAGSLCRPAAYCGVVGFKPSYGALSTRGVTPLAPSFDTVGIIAKSVNLADRAFRSMRSDMADRAAKDPDHCVTTCMLFDDTADVAAETLAALKESTAAVEAIGAATRVVENRIDSSCVVADHRVVMNREAFEAHGHLLTSDQVDLIGPKFRAGLQAGAEVTPAQAADAKARLAEAKSGFWTSMSGIDVILTLPVPEGAPLLDGTTGYQNWLTVWTVFGGPLVCLPWGLDSLDRPRSVMLAGQPGADMALLRMARALEAESPDMPRPCLGDV